MEFTSSLWDASDSSEGQGSGMDDVLVTCTSKKKSRRSRRSNGLEIVVMVQNQVQLHIATMGGSMDPAKWTEIFDLQTISFQLICTSANKRIMDQKVLINNSGDGRSLDIDTGSMWENTEGVKEVMEAVLNLVVVEQARHSDVTCAP